MGRIIYPIYYGQYISIHEDIKWLKPPTRTSWQHLLYFNSAPGTSRFNFPSISAKSSCSRAQVATTAWERSKVRPDAAAGLRCRSGIPFRWQCSWEKYGKIMAKMMITNWILVPHFQAHPHIQQVLHRWYGLLVCDFRMFSCFA